MDPNETCPPERDQQISSQSSSEPLAATVTSTESPTEEVERLSLHIDHLIQSGSIDEVYQYLARSFQVGHEHMAPTGRKGYIEGLRQVYERFPLHRQKILNISSSLRESRGQSEIDVWLLAEITGLPLGTGTGEINGLPSHRRLESVSVMTWKWTGEKWLLTSVAGLGGISHFT